MPTLKIKLTRSVLFLFFMISYPANGDIDVQRMKTQNSDLRGEREVFSFKSIVSSQAVSLLLSADGQHFVALDSQDKKKISNEIAKEMDEKFVSDFVKIKYGTTQFTGKNCKEVFLLSHRGEKEVICEKDLLRVPKAEKAFSKIRNLIK